MRSGNVTNEQVDGRDATCSPAPLVAIVDDERAIREALESLLKSVGFRVDVFASAESFICSGDRDKTNCLILDVRMPWMSGFELQERLAAANNHIPIIFITAHADETSRARAFVSGAVAFLSKPFAEEALLEAIRTTTEPNRGGSSESS